MTKVVLNSALSTYDVGIINANFAKVQAELQNKVLYRDNPTGEPNTLETDVNANNKRIYNLPEPTTSGEPLRLEDLENVAGDLQDAVEASEDAQAAAASANVSASSALSSQSNAAISAAAASASELDAENAASSAAGSASTATVQAGIATTKAAEALASAVSAEASADAAADSAAVVVGSVRFDVSQSLTAPQKAQVQANIGFEEAVLAAGFDSTETYPAGSVGAKLAKYIDVTDAPYNAVCDSGTTDNTAAFTAAIATGEFVWVPPGENGEFYKVTSKIVPVAGGGLIGAGNGSVIKLVGAITDSVIEANGVDNFTIDGIVLDGDNTTKTSGSHCLKITNCDNWYVGWLRAINAQSWAVGLYQSDNNVFGTVLSENAETSSGMFLFESSGNEISILRARNCAGFGMQIFGDSSENQIGSISAEDCGLEALGINYLGKRNRIGSVYSKNSGDNGVSITGVENTVDAVYADSPDFHGVCLYGSRNTVAKVFAKNVGQAVGSYAAVAFTPAFGGSASNNQVGPVLAWDDQGTATMQYAVKASANAETAWATGVAVTTGDFRKNASKVYVAASTGTTGATAPTHSSGTVSDGTVSWTYVSAQSDATGNKVPNVLASGFGTAMFLRIAGNDFSSGQEFNGYVALQSATDITTERRINLIAGTPETTLVGSPGDLSLRTDPQPGVEGYVKVTGTATNTGWLPLVLRRSGNTASRPSGSGSGFQAVTYYDTTLGKPIWHSGSGTTWVDANGDQPGTPTNFNSSAISAVSAGTLTGLTVSGLANVSANSSSAALTVTQTGSGNAFVVEDSASTDATPFVIDASGIVLQGKATKQQLNHFTDGAPYQMFTAGALGPQYGAFSADAFGPNFFLAKSRSATIGANTVVQSGDLLGTFQFFGADGTGFIRAAQIDAVVDGTPGTNDMPGRLVFSITADGASSPTERYRMASDGKHTKTGYVQITDNSANAALTVTQTGAGNVLVVEDSASPDGTPLVVSASGQLIVGSTTAFAASTITPRVNLQGIAGNSDAHAIGLNGFAANSGGPVIYFGKSRGATVGTHGLVSSGDFLGALFFEGSDGTSMRRGAAITGEVDGTPGASDMPGRLVFSTTADGASSTTERMRISSAGNVGIGGAAAAGRTLEVTKNVTGATTGINLRLAGIAQSDVTGDYRGLSTSLSTADAATGPSSIAHFYAHQGTISGGTRPAVVNQYGVLIVSGLTGATNNYGVFSDIASGTGRWNFYASGTADNYFAGATGIGVFPASTSNLTVAASTTAVSSLNIPHGAAPTSPVNGDMWTTTAGLFVRINGVTVGPLS